MGVIVKPYCTCGYTTKEIYLGGGMENFYRNCLLPFYCIHCKEIYGRNILKKHKGEYIVDTKIHCRTCSSELVIYGILTSFDNDEIQSKEIDDCIEWNPNHYTSYYLNRNHHYCPNCGKEEIEFEELGIWD